MFKNSQLPALLLLIFSSQIFALQDPMRPADAPDVSGKKASAASTALDASFHISSIVVGATRKFVVLNGIQMKEGDSIGDSTLARIASNYILLNKNGAVTKVYVNDPISHRGKHERNEKR